MATSMIRDQNKTRKQTAGGFSRRKILLTATLVAGAAVLATGAEAGCYIYEHSDFGGDGGRLRATWTEFLGSDVGVAMSGEAVDYVGEGWNDIVSSVRVTRHCQLTLYEHEGFTGDSRQFGPGSYDLGDTWWNDRATGAHCTCR